MLFRSVLVAGLVLPLLAAAAPDAELPRLIEQLGDDDARKRAEAAKKLEDAGEAPLENADGGGSWTPGQGLFPQTRRVSEGLPR